MSDVTLYDTTLRDGEQTHGVELLLPEKLQITQLLNDYGVRELEGGFPSASRGEREYFKRVRDLELDTKIFAFGRTHSDDIKIMRESFPDGFTVVGKADVRQVKGVLKKKPVAYLKFIRDSIINLKEKGKPVYFDAEHFFDGCSHDSFFAYDVLDAAYDAGADVLVLCDTNGGTSPDRVFNITKAVVTKFEQMRYPRSPKIGFHGHNDAGFADANTWMAYKAGARHLQGTVNRLGERCGNASLLTMACNLYRNRVSTTLNMEKTMDVSTAVEIITGFRVPLNEPYVGMNAGAHSGGMHTDGMEKMNAYQFFDLRLIGNRIWYPFGKLSGSATVVAEAKRYGVNLEKGDDVTLGLLDDIAKAGKVGDAQFYLLLNRRVHGREEPFILLRRTNIDVYDSASDPGTLSEATVHVKVNGKTEQGAGMGDGPVNAADKALRDVLRKDYPSIDKVELLFYDVASKRGGSSETGTAKFVDVYAEFTYNGHKWTSLAKHTNIIRASEIAISDAYKYFLMLADQLK